MEKIVQSHEQIKWFTEKFVQQGSSFGLVVKEKLHEEQTPFQKIKVFDTEAFGKLLVLDECIMLTERDCFIYHEMMTHPALFTHPNPGKVAIVGGGDCGVLTEVIKHKSITAAWQIDIDQRVIELSEIYFPQLTAAKLDPRVTIEHSDGIQWVANCEPELLDVIIVDSTDPVGPAEGLFTKIFFNNCFQALAGNGVFIQQSESPLYHTESIIQPMHRALKEVGFDHVKTLHFPQPVYPSGWWSATIASKQIDLDIIDNELPEKLFSTQYYNANIHQAALQLPEFMRIALLDGQSNNR